MTIRRTLDVVFSNPDGLERYVRPLTIPGLRRRYSVHSAGVPLESKVPSLDNQSGATGRLVATAGAPTLKEENGRRYLQFDGQDDTMQAVTSDASIGEGAYTVYGVGRIRAYPTVANWAIVSAGTGVQGSVFVTTTRAVSGYRGSVLPSTIDPSNQWHVFMLVCNGTSSVLCVDGVEQSGTLGVSAPGNLTLGLDSDGGTTSRVDIFEAGLFGRALTAAERTRVVSELRAEYGI